MATEENIFWFPYIIMIIIALIGFITPFFLKDNIVFGSRFPNEIANHTEVDNLKRNFKHIYLTVFIPFLIVIGIFLFNFPGDNYFNVSIYGEIILSLIIHVAYNRRSKELKKELLNRENIQPQKGVVIVDTTLRQEKFLISIWWFLPSLLIIISNILALLLYYNKIPAKIAVHFNLQGMANQFMDKSYFHVLLLPLTSIFIFCVFMVIYFSIKISKQEIDPNRPETSKLKDMHFRLIWSDYAVIMCTYSILWILFISLYATKLLILSTNTFETINIATILLLLLSSVILAVKTGQSGSKLKLKMNETTTGMNNVDDDSYWKLGMFYYNPHDPSIFIPKRYGVGWTVNFGRPTVMAITIVIVVFIVITHTILKK